MVGEALQRKQELSDREGGRKQGSLKLRPSESPVCEQYITDGWHMLSMPWSQEKELSSTMVGERGETAVEGHLGKRSLSSLTWYHLHLGSHPQN